MTFRATAVEQVAQSVHDTVCTQTPDEVCMVCEVAAEHAVAVVERNLIAEVHALHAAHKVGYHDGVRRVVCLECDCAYPCPTVALVARYEGGRSWG